MLTGLDKIRVSLFSCVFLSILFIVTFFLMVSPASGEPIYPELKDYVNDYASMFDGTNIQKMDTLLQELEKATTAQIFVATVDSLQGTTIEEYAVKLFEKWGIGQAEEDNGVLILLTKQERGVRIEGGYGLEPVITDAIAGRTINNIMVPRFKKGDFGLGTYEAVAYLSSLIAKDTGVSLNALEHYSTSGVVIGKYLIFIGLAAFFILFAGCFTAIYFILSKRRLKRLCPNCKTPNLKTTYKILKEATYIAPGWQLIIMDCSHCGFHDEKEVEIPRRSYSSGSSWSSGSSSSHSSGSSSGGGFSGGGGGSSGGGGASGSW